MSRFIPKKTLIEGMAANPLDKGVAEEQDITALAQEGILTAAAAETDAINQYMQILDMVDKSESWLGNLVKPTLEDIIAEEKKHFAQLSTIISKLPAFEKEFEAGVEEAETSEDKEEPKEEVEESVTIEAEDRPIEVETIYVNDAVDPETGIEYIAAYEDSQACLNQEEPTVYLDIDQFKKLQELVNAGSLKIITRDELLVNNSTEEIK